MKDRRDYKCNLSGVRAADGACGLWKRHGNTVICVHTKPSRDKEARGGARGRGLRPCRGPGRRGRVPQRTTTTRAPRRRPCALSQLGASFHHRMPPKGRRWPRNADGGGGGGGGGRSTRRVTKLQEAPREQDLHEERSIHVPVILEVPARVDPCEAREACVCTRA